MPRRARFGVAALAAGLAATAVAQQAPDPGSGGAGETVPQPVPAISPFLTIDQEEVFTRSAFGRRVQAELEAATAALAAENRAIEAELAEEERRLTELRATMDPAEFRALADAFDARVVAARRTQDAKTRELARRPEEARAAFFRAAVPILAQIVRDRGAMAILDARAVLLSSDAIDITEEAIARLDDTIGDGGSVLPALAAPEAEDPPSPAP